ncbi:MAG TPA: phosphoribosylanthranilate isomerase [Chthoniobacterales bacterium]|nr:phosphoribosylanthranilate isomerase [Chthoniobacterales bacterium]
MLRVKICGLTTPQDAAAAIEFGADALGFNFFRGSKRFVGDKVAWISDLPGIAQKIAILVNPSWDEAMRVARIPGISALQLHGNETPDFCRRLMTEGIRFEKAIPVTGRDSLIKVPDFSTNTILLDSNASGEFGGSGRTFPWEIGRRFAEDNPHLRVILAGGLTAENVAEAVAAVQPFGVDVTTGVEASPGRKDYRRLQAFFVAARRA